MLVFLSEVLYFINEQVQPREWHLRHYKCPQILLACLKLNLDSLFLGIDKVEPLWPVLVYSLTLSVKPSIGMVIFQNQLGLEKKTHCFSNVLPHTVLTHFLLYLAQSHQNRRHPSEPPTKTEIVCWGWWGQGQCQQHFSWPCLIFLLAFFLTFSLVKCTIFPPNSKF